MAERGYILLYREILEKPIWKLSTAEQKTILIALLLMAWHNENEWEWKGKNFKVLPGQFVTSLDGILKKCGKGVSLQNIRTAIKRFEKLQFLTSEPTRDGRLVTILNWRLYQDGKTKLTSKLTVTQQAPNKELTPNKELKELKELKINNIYSEVIDYLNQKTNSKFRVTASNKKNITARINEKATLEDFKIVIDTKHKQWDGTEYRKYLRPQTLFGTKFDSYLNEKIKEEKGRVFTDDIFND